MFEFDERTFRLFIVILLLVILGIVSFNAYFFVSAKDDIKIGAGAGMGFSLPFMKQ
uniref:Transmembrane protein n=1 Tax=Mimivirus LCMiAC02 TaxID=2506609 RepID=A0A481Z0L9_9VIRU|nr:MAG: hypothetical protein LCMiAC02_01460 [Mimivirus LCMiAC02]